MQVFPCVLLHDLESWQFISSSGITLLYSEPPEARKSVETLCLKGGALYGTYFRVVTLHLWSYCLFYVMLSIFPVAICSCLVHMASFRTGYTLSIVRITISESISILCMVNLPGASEYELIREAHDQQISSQHQACVEKNHCVDVYTVVWVFC
jgi:hypothetical protein